MPQKAKRRDAVAHYYAIGQGLALRVRPGDHNVDGSVFLDMKPCVHYSESQACEYTQTGWMERYQLKYRDGKSTTELEIENETAKQYDECLAPRSVSQSALLLLRNHDPPPRFTIVSWTMDSLLKLKMEQDMEDHIEHTSMRLQFESVTAFPRLLNLSAGLALHIRPSGLNVDATIMLKAGVDWLECVLYKEAQTQEYTEDGWQERYAAMYGDTEEANGAEMTARVCRASQGVLAQRQTLPSTSFISWEDNELSLRMEREIKPSRRDIGHVERTSCTLVFASLYM